VALGLQVNFIPGLLGALILGTACYQSVTPAPRTSGAPANPIAAPHKTDTAHAPTNTPTAANLGDPAQQFIVLKHSGEIVLRSIESTATRTLAPHADDALYHATLELVWFKDGDRLSVIDLRALGMPPVVIALGMESVEGKLSIAHGPLSAETEDGCDVPLLTLNWTEKPTIEMGDPDADAENLRIVNAAWLQKELSRPARQQVTRRRFGQPHLPLPKSLMRCEDSSECDATTSFGARGLQLVQVSQKMGGDCWRRGCLVRDPQRDLFATPPHVDTWGTAEKTKPGSCGLYLFDRDQTAYLVGRELCVPGHDCQNLDGWALGWRVPGDAVGAP
jgi:hypothetical protein